MLHQAEGSSEVTGSNGGESIHGTLSGNTFSFTSETGSGYVATGTLTVSADGLSWSGPVSDTGGTSGIYTAQRAATMGTVAGKVVDELRKPVKGVALKLTGKTDEGEALVKTDSSADDGSYSFEVPAGSYSVLASGEPTEENGGTLRVSGSLTTPGADECDGVAAAKPASCALNHVAIGETVHATFLYTRCAATERLPNGKPPTGCPIIFIPGFLGSRLQCSSGETWTNIPSPDWADMRLQSDGATNFSGGGPCAASVAPMSGEEGVVKTAATKDIYGEALAYLNRIAPGRVYAYPYDWRKSPIVAQAGLQQQVEDVLKSTSASRVVLVAHSMGGLVLQQYVADPAHAEKVIRALTLGTPYWGAPKSHVALLSGKSNEVENETFGLDLFTASSIAEAASRNPVYVKAVNDLQFAARTMQGLYWLNPSERFGPWLQVKAPGYPAGFMSSGQLRAWITSLGGTAQLLSNAVAGHQALDGFKTNGVDYQVMVGAGVPTMAAASIELDPSGLTQPVSVSFDSGDGTVPLVSATQGASEGHAPLGDAVGVHYACGVDHLSLPANAGVQSRVEGFLLKGEPIAGPESNCPYTGVSLKLFKIPVAEQGAARAGAVEGVSVIAASGAVLTLTQARDAGLVQAVQFGGERYLVSGSNAPVSFRLSGANLAFEVQTLNSAKGNRAGSSAPVIYRSSLGTVTVGPTGAVMRGAKRMRPVRKLALPRTVARISRHGLRFVVRLSARAPAGLGAIYVRVGHRKAVRYSKPLLLTRAMLKSLRFEAVDALGRWERPHRAHP